MAEVLLPPWIIPEEERHEWLDEGSSVFRAAFAPGLAQRQSYGGLRLKLSRRHTVRGEEKAQLLAVLKSTRGAYNVLRTKVHFASRGSGVEEELLTNNTFANGTTGWTAGGETTLSSSDRILRLTRSEVTAAQDALSSGANTVVQYAPYVARAFLLQGNGSYSTFKSTIGSTQAANDYASGTASASYGMHSVAGVARSTTAYFGVEDLASSGPMAGDYFSTSYVSMSRCMLVDAGQNLLLWSDQFAAANWTSTRVTVGANVTTAPDGTSTADTITEDSTASSTHFVQQGFTVSSSAASFCFAVALKAGSRSFARINIIENTGATTAFVDLNLSDGSTQNGSPGANWSDVRSFSVDLGDGWWMFAMVARKTNAATSLTARLNIATSLGGVIYSGDGSSNIYAWRATASQSAVPSRLVLTQSASTAGTSPTGTAMYVKGLQESTDGLLLPGDWFEINGELKQVTDVVNSDESGLGYLQFEPALVRSPSDNDPIVLTDPMGKFIVSNIKIENEFGTQARVSYDLEHIYE